MQISGNSMKEQFGSIEIPLNKNSMNQKRAKNILNGNSVK